MTTSPTALRQRAQRLVGALTVYLRPRVLIVLLLGFSGGLPLALSGETLRLDPPWLSRWLGRRRGWLLATQGLAMGAIVFLGTRDPLAGPLIVGSATPVAGAADGVVWVLVAPTLMDFDFATASPPDS